MSDTRRVAPPELVFPERREIPPPLNCKPFTDRPLSIRYVTGLDLPALLANIISVGIFFTLMSTALGRKWDNQMITIAIPLAIIWIMAVCFHHRLWTKVDARKAQVYLNNLSRWMVIYRQGFHFVCWFSSKEIDEVDFQRHEIITAEKKSGTEVRFPSLDGYDMCADLKILFSRRDSPDALSKSLKYQLDNLRDWIWAVVVGRLSDIGACNSYATLLKHKPDVAVWIANIFGGEDKISPFEDETGTAIKNPVLKDLDLSDASKRVFSVGAKIKAIAEGAAKLREQLPGITEEEAALTAQAAEGAATRVIHTYEGIPKDAKVVALGDGAVAVAGKGSEP